MLGEADLVDSGGPSRVDVRLDRFDAVIERPLLPFLVAPEVHVVVGDQSSAATRSRSAPSVTLISLGSPGTTLTRPPRASTSEAQSLAAPVSPA